MDNYPDWTWEGDPRAPWNEPDNDEIYGDRANDIIDDEINDSDDKFVDWCIDSGYMPKEAAEASMETLEEILDNIRENDEILSEYREWRWDDVINDCAEDAYDNYYDDDDRDDY